MSKSATYKGVLLIREDSGLFSLYVNSAPVGCRENMVPWAEDATIDVIRGSMDCWAGTPRQRRAIIAKLLKEVS